MVVKGFASPKNQAPNILVKSLPASNVGVWFGAKSIKYRFVGSKRLKLNLGGVDHRTLRIDTTILCRPTATP